MEEQRVSGEGLVNETGWGKGEGRGCLGEGLAWISAGLRAPAAPPKGCCRERAEAESVRKRLADRLGRGGGDRGPRIREWVNVLFSFLSGFTSCSWASLQALHRWNQTKVLCSQQRDPVGPKIDLLVDFLGP